jgi:hypothetical protein
MAYQLVDRSWTAVRKMVDKFTHLNTRFYQDDSVEGLAMKAGLPWKQLSLP